MASISASSFGSGEVLPEETHFWTNAEGEEATTGAGGTTLGTVLVVVSSEYG
jgi:hypothetical protein